MQQAASPRGPPTCYIAPSPLVAAPTACSTSSNSILIESLIDSYEKLGNIDGVERERRYILQIVQQNYGVDDPRTVPALTRLAEWYEHRVFPRK